MQSNPTDVGLGCIDRRVLGALSNEASLIYEPSPFGLSEAREAVAGWYRSIGLSVRGERLLLTASSSEAYSFLLKLLCDPGDSILVPSPSYPLFDHLARLECVSVDRYPLMEEDGWCVDELALRDAVQPTTRAIFLVSPNNPTGSYVHDGELRVYEAVAREHDLVLVSDEVFAEYVWREASDRVRCVALESRVPAFSLGGLSKSACMPQMKLGWIVMGDGVSRDVVRRLEMIADTYLSVSAPVQHAAKVFLDGARCARDLIAERIAVNLGVLRRLISGTCLSLGPVDAGWYGCLRVPAIMTDEEWAVMLVRHEGVLSHPGSFFGFGRAGTLVVGLIGQSDIFEEGVRRLVRRVELAVA